MIAAVSKRFTFEAAHWLNHVPKDHKCSRLHGHSYGVEILVKGPIGNVSGMVVDYAEIALAWAPLFLKLDHRNLNEVLAFETTAENIAAWLLAELRRSERFDPSDILGVRVFETPSTMVEVSE
ncbi:6-carboxytetrahydropterin synthase QueD [Candidatus Parcubacteria bacterium]|nr:6-carboxytetrahydropterin synthase QueD [Candidatus Parcubacteria bacterium]